VKDVVFSKTMKEIRLILGALGKTRLLLPQNTVTSRPFLIFIKLLPSMNFPHQILQWSWFNRGIYSLYWFSLLILKWRMGFDNLTIPAI